MAEKPFIVGIGGVSGTGKSTLAKNVASALGGGVLTMETYSFTPAEMPFEEREKSNFDEPKAIDIDLLEQHIAQYGAGHDIEAPIYDFATHLRVAQRTLHIRAGTLLIVEGILAFHFPQLRSRFDLAVYLQAPEDVCFRRRQVRDITERQRPLELIRWQYENTVMPAARRYVLPSKRFADMVLECTGEPEVVAEELKRAIEQRRAKAAAI